MGHEAERRLAAVLAADVVGYSRLMGADEAGTLAALRSVRDETLEPSIERHRGAVVKRLGDGWLAEFASAVDAVNCALAVQEKLAAHDAIRLRIGVHVGDVVHEAGDIFGDGVNVAARLEAIAPPGGVTISDHVYSSLDGTLAPAFRDGGERALKNIARPVRVWEREAAPGADGGAAAADERAALSLPLVACSDRRAELRDLSAALSRDLAGMLETLPWLEVHRGARGGAYRLGATLRASGERLRLDAELTSPGGAPLWSGRYDGALDEVFDWQDATVETLASAVRTRLMEVELKALSTRRPEELTARQCLLLGTYCYEIFSPANARAAYDFLRLAIAKDPTSGLAHARAAGVLALARANGWAERFGDAMGDLERLAGRALALAPDEPEALILSAILAMQEGEPLALARGDIERAIWRAPNDGWVHTWVGWAYLYGGDPAASLDHFRRALRLSPFDRSRIFAENGLALALLRQGAFEKAAERARRAIALGPDYPSPWRVLVSACGHLGDARRAKEAKARLLRLSPDESVSRIEDANNLLRDAEAPDPYVEGLRKAGLAE